MGIQLLNGMGHGGYSCELYQKVYVDHGVDMMPT